MQSNGQCLYKSLALFITEALSYYFFMKIVEVECRNLLRIKKTLILNNIAFNENILPLFLFCKIDILFEDM